jgi:hypothetical protein
VEGTLFRRSVVCTSTGIKSLILIIYIYLIRIIYIIRKYILFTVYGVAELDDVKPLCIAEDGMASQIID